MVLPQNETEGAFLDQQNIPIYRLQRDAFYNIFLRIMITNALLVNELDLLKIDTNRCIIEELTNEVDYREDTFNNI